LQQAASVGLYSTSWVYILFIGLGCEDGCQVP
jgi:hypothetical protein